jgi:hypothetical protein
MNIEQSHLTQSIINELEQLNAVISSDVKSRSKTQKYIEKLLTAIKDNNFILVNQYLKQGSTLINTSYPQARQTINNLMIDTNRHLDEQLQQTRLQLENYCNEQGFQIKNNGMKFTIHHYIDVEFDQKTGRTKIGNKSINTFAWGNIKTALDLENVRLWGRDISLVDFQDSLSKAYKQIEKTDTKTTNWVSLDDIYQILKVNMEKENPNWKKGGRLISYYKDEFCVDLSLFWNAQASEKMENPNFEFSAIRDPRKAYKLIQPDNNIGFYGFLRPRGN